MQERTSGTARFSSVINENGCVYWTDGMYATGNCVSGIDRRVGIGPRATSWNEDSTMERTFYSNWTDTPTAYDWSSSHRVSYVRSSDGYSASEIMGSLSHCTSMNGFLTCAATTPVNSSRMLSVSYATGAGRSVTAWVNQNRLDDTNDHEIKVAVGYVNNTTLPTPSGLGVGSLVSPGLACLNNAASGYDCMIAYVDPTDDYHTVRVKRFSPMLGVTHYLLSVDSTTTSLPVRSSSSLAAWASQGRFWLAIRPAEADQETLIYSSADSVSWTKEGTTWGYSVVGPSVASQWTGSNIVLTWK
jgi:hypothetical protein